MIYRPSPPLKNRMVGILRLLRNRPRNAQAVEFPTETRKQMELDLPTDPPRKR